ncbi:MAG: sulfurtransferase [Burkholderiales bacterium]|nr:sulfurtransferase [Burkholderiales bacterium]
MSPTTRLHSPLLSVAELQSELAGAAPPLLLDASFELADPSAGRRAWEQAHIPGSCHVDLEADLCGPRSGRNGRHPLPERVAFARTAAALGVRPGRSVVVLDRGDGAFAARLWWMLRWLGHADVRVLDGGLKAWTAAGGELVDGSWAPPAAADAAYPERAPLAATIDADTLQARLAEVLLIDARGAARYRGEVEPIDPVAGHIPGALNRPYTENLAPDGLFLSPPQLRQAFAALGLTPDQPRVVVSQCGSGVTACHNLLALEVAGLPGGLLYPGSWSEWCADPARPVATGA